MSRHKPSCAARGRQATFDVAAARELCRVFSGHVERPLASRSQETRREDRSLETPAEPVQEGVVVTALKAERNSETWTSRKNSRNVF